MEPFLAHGNSKERSAWWSSFLWHKPPGLSSTNLTSNLISQDPSPSCHPRIFVIFFFLHFSPSFVLSKEAFKRPTHDYFSSPSPFEVLQCLLREASDVTHRITIKNECLRAVESCGPHWNSSGGGRRGGGTWDQPHYWDFCPQVLPITVWKTHNICFQIFHKSLFRNESLLNASRSKWPLRTFLL